MKHIGNFSTWQDYFFAQALEGLGDPIVNDTITINGTTYVCTKSEYVEGDGQQISWEEKTQINVWYTLFYVGWVYLPNNKITPNNYLLSL